MSRPFKTTAKLAAPRNHFERDANFLWRLHGHLVDIVVTPLSPHKYRAATKTDVTE